MRALATLCVLGMLLMATGCGGSSRSQTTNLSPFAARQRLLREAHHDAAHSAGPTNYGQIARAAIRAVPSGKNEGGIQISHLPPQQKKLLLRLLHKGKTHCTRKQTHRLEQAIRASTPAGEASVEEVSVNCPKRMP